MKTSAALLFFITSLLLSQQASAIERQRSPWYIGVGLGSALSAEYKTSEGTSSFSDFSQDSTTLGLRFKVGGTLAPKHLLGADLGFYSSSGSDGYYADYSISMSHEMVVYTFFPATKGFFLHTGLGAGRMTQRVDFSYYQISKKTSDGWASLFGGGYSFWLTKRFNIGLNLDLEYQKYTSSSGDSPAVDSASLAIFYVTADWY